MSIVIRILMEVTLNQHIDFGNVDIFTILILTIRECGKSFYMPSSISLVFKFFCYRGLSLPL